MRKLFSLDKQSGAKKKVGWSFGGRITINYWWICIVHGKNPKFFVRFSRFCIKLHSFGSKNITLHDKYYIDKPIAITESWRSNFKNDPDAYFYYGVLKLIKAIHHGSEEMFSQAKNSLEQCKKMFENDQESKPQKKFRYKEYLIAKKNGDPLKSLLRFDDNIDLKLLDQFESELSSDGKHFKYHGFLIEYSDKNALNENSKIRSIEKGHRNIYNFHIGIRGSGLLAFKYLLKQQFFLINWIFKE